MKTNVIDSVHETLSGVDLLLSAKKTRVFFDNCNHSVEGYRVQRGSEYFRIGEKI